MSGIHAYVNLGDGGCWKHLEDDGRFKSTTDREEYLSKWCPFPQDTRTDRARRQTMIDLRSQGIGRGPLGVAKCLGSKRNATCDTVMAIPLMFEAIGFNGGQGRGGLYEESKSAEALEKECYGFQTADIGPASFARLVLRAVLPTYYRHVYVNNFWEMVGAGAYSMALQVRFSSWLGNRYKNPVAAVRAAWTSSDPQHELESMFTQTALQDLKSPLISQSVMERDRADTKECATAPISQRGCFVAVCWYFADDFWTAMDQMGWNLWHER